MWLVRPTGSKIAAPRDWKFNFSPGCWSHLGLKFFFVLFLFLICLQVIRIHSHKAQAKSHRFIHNTSKISGHHKFIHINTNTFTKSTTSTTQRQIIQKSWTTLDLDQQIKNNKNTHEKSPDPDRRQGGSRPKISRPTATVVARHRAPPPRLATGPLRHGSSPHPSLPPGAPAAAPCAWVAIAAARLRVCAGRRRRCPQRAARSYNKKEERKED